MLELAHPWALTLIPLPLLAWRFLPPRRQRVSALRVPFFSALVEAAGLRARSGAVVPRRRPLQWLSAALVWLLLVFGLGGPQWVGEPIVRTEAARDVMLAIDLSASMDAVDFPAADGQPVRRMDAVRRVVGRFVADRSEDRIGLIVFGRRAYLQLPFTQDLETARALVALMDVGMAGPQTAIGDAIGLAIHAFQDSEIEQRLLILLTDGSDTASRMAPINAADVARLEGIQIYTIGIGDPEATGEERVDFAALRAVAERTGGAFFEAGDEAALGAIYQRIDQLVPADQRTLSWRPRDSLVHWPAGAALVATLLTYLALLLGARRRTPAP